MSLPEQWSAALVDQLVRIDSGGLCINFDGARASAVENGPKSELPAVAGAQREQKLVSAPAIGNTPVSARRGGSSSACINCIGISASA